ncbi:DegT/DnrJ/EryC1/StrS family aminotransferase [Candidatus Sumerlaeota bacterium]|nr:DegT/DnrJ/EryC1/StrS family aminotransferase [Candidatus Sumerlaeota bacterium]
MSFIPLVDLKAQYRAIKPEIDRAIQQSIDSAEFIMGERVRKFEEEFAEFCGARFAVACSSGTTALHLALLCCGVGQGDEVITVSHTFIATAEPICHCGATPVFVDVDPETYNIDVNLIEQAITPRTKAIIPVHLYGQPADMDPILRIAQKYGLKVIEDAAQAVGAEYKGRRVGTIGDFGCFSFFPAKNLGAYGDAGMVTTSNESDARRLRMLVNHGRETKYEHKIVGYNYRMDALQAGILSVKLQHLADWTEARRRLAHRYNELLKGLPVVTPAEKFHHVYHLYVIQCDNRDELQKALESEGIATGIHYPIPLHLQPCFQDLPGAGKGHFPVTEKIASRILSLPMFPELTDTQQDRIAETIRKFYEY